VTPAAEAAAIGPVRSPYERALGDRFTGLHPQLQVYFAAIPEGSVGHGTGTFDTVGARRWWARAALRLLGGGVLFPVWERDVPFTVVNRPERGAAGRIAVAAARTFHLRGGDRVMTDRVTTAGGALVDVVGSKRRFRARFEPSVAEAGLRLDSTGVELRIGRRHLRIPRPLAPRIRLTERAAMGAGLQHISITVELPIAGRFYEYAGTFTYAIRTESP
jgi:Domain of unknown function (DUF4166)